MGIELSAKLKSFKPFLFEGLYRKERAERAKGKDIISLAVGDPDIPTDARIVADAIKELKNGRNHRYPNTKGNENLRREAGPSPICDGVWLGPLPSARQIVFRLVIAVAETAQLPNSPPLPGQRERRPPPSYILHSRLSLAATISWCNLLPQAP